MFDIYVIRNIINEKKYIGYTSKGYKTRFRLHIKEAYEGNTSRYLCKAIRKYGKENFTVELLETVETHELAVEKEIYYIQKMNTFAHKKGSHGYNATLGGEGVNGKLVPQSMRDKMSKIKKDQLAWVGKNNPMYKKGYLIAGDKHPLFGKNHSSETKSKISQSNKGRHIGINNPASKLTECYSLECKTGKIEMFSSFYEMQQFFISLGMKLNRSIVLGIMRMDKGKKSYKRYKFFREDVTPNDIFSEIRRKYQMKIFEPIELKDHRQGEEHPKAKNMICFASEISTGKIYRFESWYELKRGLGIITGKEITYSSLFKVLTGKYKQTTGYHVFREDITEKSTFSAISDNYEIQKEPSTTSREA
ncbi:hypothetical protein BVG16_13775 [Paenibacillus selenitireducens]|uniref:GIY-YIG domain-containing protein n=1 Tax=Paenibacillus selenitireducens TaxID=1324314 RepID=A0A1T2XCU9_9BACL|nr:GIY-YIG nuclease family protein [Paenibacillus selenitireducens]OPA77516.1 hypothetical protein BVG16_13775 [Paenibacillus selenitireducens]